MITYQWDVEEVAADDSEECDAGEILEHLFCSTYAQAKAQAAHPEDGCKSVTVLVRDDDSGGRSWAYIVDGKLPDMFQDAYQNDCVKVPRRFHKEVAAASLSL